MQHGALGQIHHGVATARMKAQKNILPIPADGQISPPSGMGFHLMLFCCGKRLEAGFF
ncbi:hypothetical protein AA0312_0618 [Acetobacter tropicalis NRIC 0312]|nr:hypothetical protein ATR1_064d0006 [Acetobacter tropicalis]GBR67828.1 hypothetical protein AA0312_0618 [Acetobacter tropicalis NRIC 0312]